MDTSALAMNQCTPSTRQQRVSIILTTILRKSTAGSSKTTTGHIFGRVFSFWQSQRGYGVDNLPNPITHTSFRATSWKTSKTMQTDSLQGIQVEQEKRMLLSQDSATLASTISNGEDSFLLEEYSFSNSDEIGVGEMSFSDFSAIDLDDASIYEHGPQKPSPSKDSNAPVGELILDHTQARACLEELNSIFIFPSDAVNTEIETKKRQNLIRRRKETSPVEIPPSSPHPPSLRTSDRNSPEHPSERPNLQRTVSFSQLSIREYGVSLSEHPACSYGPPIQLDWTVQHQVTLPVDAFEATRCRTRCKNRHELLLSAQERCRWLLRRQYSPEELDHAMNQVDRVKRERQLTDCWLPVSMLQEHLFETVEHVQQVLTQPPRVD